MKLRSRRTAAAVIALVGTVMFSACSPDEDVPPTSTVPPWQRTSAPFDYKGRRMRCWESLGIRSCHSARSVAAQLARSVSWSSELEPGVAV